MNMIALFSFLYCIVLFIKTHHIKYKWMFFSILALLASYFVIIKIVFSILFSSIFILSLIIYFLGNKKVEEGINYMMIFGYQLENNQILPLLKYRLDKAIQYLNNHPDMKVIVSGGITRKNTVSESSKMVEYLINHDISNDRIIEETKSTITLENLTYSKDIVGSIHEPILLVTNQFHMFRCIVLAKFVGYTHIYQLPCYSGIEVIDKLVEEIYFFIIMLKKRSEY